MHCAGQGVLDVLLAACRLSRGVVYQIERARAPVDLPGTVHGAQQHRAEQRNSKAAPNNDPLGGQRGVPHCAAHINDPPST
eukprot:7051122-Pyramimonas_sp.AAC.1